MKRTFHLGFILFIVTMTITVCFCWFRIYNLRTFNKENYLRLLEQAQYYEEKEIYIDALESYLQALDIDDNKDLTLKVADMYLKLDDETNFLKYCNKAVSSDPQNCECNLTLANYYIEHEQFESAFTTLNAITPDNRNDTVNNLIDTLLTKYEKEYTLFTFMGDWNRQDSDSYIAVCQNNKWGLVNSKGSFVIKANYDWIGAYDQDTGLIPCNICEQFFYIDLNAYKRIAPDKNYTYMGAFGNQLAPVAIGDRWGFVDKELNEYCIDYSFCGAFANGVAAVKKGEKWALIGADLQLKTEFIYDRIFVDSNGFCSLFPTIIAIREKRICFLSVDGTERCETAYVDASLPASSQGLIAVSDGNKWGFVDINGSTVLSPRFDEAKSFCCNLAPVKIGEFWGYIDIHANIVINPAFDDANVFTDCGVAAVSEGCVYSTLKLTLRNYLYK